MTKSLLVYTQNGLANRLRVLASASIMAEWMGRKLLLNWTPSEACNVLWEELFVNQFDRCTMPLSKFRAGIDLYDNYLIPKTLYGDYPQLSIRNDADMIALNTCYNFKPEGMTNEAYQLEKSLFYRNLRPLENIKTAVNDIQRRYFDGHNVIGIHIRRNDHLSFLRKDHQLVCPTKMFAQAIENIMIEDPETKIFLATDDKQEEKFFRQLFHNAVIVYKKEEVKRNTRKGMQDALIDWLLLAKTSMIIASYSSSFSEEASVVNRIKKHVIVKEDELSKTHFKAHYRVLKNDGIRKYCLFFYNYRIRQIGNWCRIKLLSNRRDN
jgi:hypothetical protein